MSIRRDYLTIKSDGFTANAFLKLVEKLCLICRLNRIKEEAMEPDPKTSPVDMLKQYGLMAIFAVLGLLLLSGLVMA